MNQPVHLLARVAGHSPYLGIRQTPLTAQMTLLEHIQHARLGYVDVNALVSLCIAAAFQAAMQ
ncbi:MAG: hypothetical protein U1F00_05475 [Rhodoferax sp.]